MDSIIERGGCEETPNRNVSTLSERADAIELKHLQELGDRMIGKSVLYNLANGKRIFSPRKFGVRLLMGEDPRLPPMPAKPTLLDFFRCRFDIVVQEHLLHSAALAQKDGHSDRIVLACLLHDIALAGFISADHGFWGAQLVEPYVDEEVSWAIRAHQALRFFPDESVGYQYPDLYRTMFGDDYRPEPHIVAAYEEAKQHKWYMTGRIICLNDLYSFNAGVHVELGQFEDIIGREFRQPVEGLGNDNTPASHMWRTMRRPCNAL